MIIVFQIHGIRPLSVIMHLVKRRQIDLFRTIITECRNIKKSRLKIDVDDLSDESLEAIELLRGEEVPMRFDRSDRTCIDDLYGLGVKSFRHLMKIAKYGDNYSLEEFDMFYIMKNYIEIIVNSYLSESFIFNNNFELSNYLNEHPELFL